MKKKILAIAAMTAVMTTLAQENASKPLFIVDRIVYEGTSVNGNTVIVKSFFQPSSIYYSPDTYSRIYPAVTIPATVTFEGKEYTVCGLGVNALKKLRASELTLPSTIKTLDDECLAYMSIGNKSLVLPDNIEAVGHEILEGTRIDRLKVPNYLRKYDDVRDFTRLCFAKHIETDFKKNYIMPCTFEYCLALEEFTVPDNVLLIDQRAFRNCFSLAGINLPEGLVMIKAEAFAQIYSRKAIRSYENFGPQIYEGNPKDPVWRYGQDILTPPYIWTPEIIDNSIFWPLDSNAEPVDFKRFKAVTIPSTVTLIDIEAFRIPALTSFSLLGPLPEIADLELDEETAMEYYPEVYAGWRKMAIALQNNDVEAVAATYAGEGKQRVKVEIDPALGVDEVRWVMTDATDDLSTAILRNGMTLLLPQDATVRFLLPDNDNPFEVAIDGKPVFDSTGTASVKFSGRDNTTLQFRPSGTGIETIGSQAENALLYRLDGTQVNEAAPGPGIYLRVTPGGAEKILIK